MSRFDSGMAQQEHLRDEQKQALRHIIMGEGDITIVSGMAGTGKTTLLKAAREIWESAGYEVRGAALAGKAGTD